MKELEKVLDNCLKQMQSGQVSLDDCLRQNPAQASELRPMLEAALVVGRGRGLNAARPYKTRARSTLMNYWEAHPKRRSGISPLALRLTGAIAMALAVLMLAGTAYAQNALPGQTFYGWKITSEKAWRAVAPDPLSVDLTIADRRAEELTIAVKQRNGASEQAQALQEYHAILEQLQSEANPTDMGQIMQTLQSHRQQFQEAGFDVPQLDALLHGNGNNNSGGGGGGGNSGGGGGGSGGGGGGGKP